MKRYLAAAGLMIFCILFCVDGYAQTITVGPVSGSIVACSGSASISPFYQRFRVTGTGLTGNVRVTAPANFEATANLSVGFNPVHLLVPNNGSVDFIIYVRAAAGAPIGGISGAVLLTSPGAGDKSVMVAGTVSPLPTVNVVPDQTVANGAFTTAINFTGNAQDYTWTNSDPGIGLAVNGAGNIPLFKAVNTGSLPVTATITVTPKPGSLAYVANSGDNTISVINTATNTATKVTVGNSPTKTIVSPDGTRVYVANYSDGTISTVDATTNTEISKVTLKKFPADIELSPDGSTLYVVSTGGNVATVINTATNATQEFKIDANPVVMIRNPGGSKIYSANFGPPGTVTVINTASNAVQTSIPNINNTGDIAITPNGATLYLTDSYQNLVNVVSTATNTLTTTVPVGSFPSALAMHPNGSRVYVSNQTSNNISVINTANNQVVATIPVGAYIQGISISADGTFLYAVGFNSQTVSVVNTVSNTVVATIPMSGNLGRPAITPDGSRLLIPELIGGTVYIVNTATNKVIGNVPAGKNPTLYNNSVSSGLGCSGSPITFTITVNPPPPPVISHFGTPVARNATFGTVSTSTFFNVAANNLTTGVLVTPPAGFEVSTDDITFTPTVTLGSTGSLSSARVYIRLSRTANAATYVGDIVLTSGPTTDKLAMPASTVAPAPITLNAGGISKAYGQALTNYTGTDLYTFTAGALKNGNTITLVTQSYGTGGAATDAVGSYAGTVTIVAVTGDNGFLAANYNITLRPGGIVVTPADLVIRANDLDKTYGTVITGGPGATAFTATGLRNGETIGSISVTYGTGTAAKDAINIYKGSIIPSAPTGGTFKLSNYNITDLLPGNINVVPALLVVTADDKSRDYRAPDPVFTYSYNGFVNNETEAVLTTRPTLTTPATVNSQWGTYPIIPAGALAANYAITYRNGTLTVIPPVTLPGAVLSVTNTFTPNGDGINDTWNIPALSPYPNCTVQIFDRRGVIVFNSIGYPKAWDGTYRGNYLPSGVYYYMIDPKLEAKVLSGTITIIR